MSNSNEQDEAELEYVDLDCEEDRRLKVVCPTCESSGRKTTVYIPWSMLNSKYECQRCGGKFVVRNAGS